MRKSSDRFVNRVCVAIIAIGAWGLVNPLSADVNAYEREIHLKGASNTRDIGGYVTSDLGVLLKEAIHGEANADLAQQAALARDRSGIDLGREHD